MVDVRVGVAVVNFGLVVPLCVRVVTLSYFLDISVVYVDIYIPVLVVDVALYLLDGVFDVLNCLLYRRCSCDVDRIKGLLVSLCD